MLLGINYICKNTGNKNIKSLVNSYQIDPEYLRFILTSLQDSDMDALIVGELYETLLDIEMSIDELLNGKPKQGSAEWFLSMMDTGPEDE